MIRSIGYLSYSTYSQTLKRRNEDISLLNIL